MSNPDYASQPGYSPVPQSPAWGAEPAESLAAGGPTVPQGGAGYPPAPGYPAAPGYQGVPGVPMSQGVPYPSAYPGAPYLAVQDPATVNCAIPWFLGLIALIPLPFFGSFAGGLTQVISGLTWKVEGAERGRTQARQAASWGLTYLLCTVVLTVAHFWVLFVYTREGPSKAFFPVGIPLLLLALLTLLHLVLCVVGGIRANQGKTMPFYGIPFFR